MDPVLQCIKARKGPKEPNNSQNGENQEISTSLFGIIEYVKMPMESMKTTCRNEIFRCKYNKTFA